MVTRSMSNKQKVRVKYTPWSPGNVGHNIDDSKSKNINNINQLHRYSSRDNSTSVTRNIERQFASSYPKPINTTLYTIYHVINIYDFNCSNNDSRTVVNKSSIIKSFQFIIAYEDHVITVTPPLSSNSTGIFRKNFLSSSSDCSSYGAENNRWSVSKGALSPREQAV